MDKDAKILNELSLNDKIKVTVNFFGQEMPFKGIYQGICDDKLSLKTDAKPDPLDLPVAEIKEIDLISKYENKNLSSGAAENEDDEFVHNYYKNITLDSPDFVGYCIVGKLYNNDRKINVEHCFDVDEIPLKNFIVIRNHFNRLENENFIGSFLRKGFSECQAVLEYETDGTDFQKTVEELKNVIEPFIIHDFITPCKQFDDDKIKFHTVERLNEGKKELLDSIYSFLIYFSKAKYWLNEIIRIKGQENKEYQKSSLLKVYNSFVNSFLCIVDAVFWIFDIAGTFYNFEGAEFKVCSFNYNDYYQFEKVVYVLAVIGNYYKHMEFENGLYEYDFLDSKIRKQLKIEWMKGYSGRLHRLFYNKQLGFEYAFPDFFPFINRENESEVYEFILFFYYLSFNSSNLGCYIKFINNDYSYKINEIIKYKYEISCPVDEAFYQMYEIFQKQLSQMKRDLYLLDGNLYLDEIDYREVNEFASNILNIIKTYGSRYLFVTKEYIDRLSEYISRLVLITDGYGNNFVKAEKSFLIGYETCMRFIASSDKEPASSDIVTFLEKSNAVTHTRDFSEHFYSRYIPEIYLKVVREQISINSDLKTVYIPFELVSSKDGQPANITEFEIVNSATGYSHDDPVMHTVVNPGSALYSIAEIELDEAVNNIVNIQLAFNITFRYKSSYDFEKNEFFYGTKTVTEYADFIVDVNKDSEFKDIRNLFKDYSSGSVVQDEKMFFGRERDINEVITNIRDENNRIISNRCVCIYGQTRTGKSSLLYHIKKRLRENSDNVIVDIGDIGSIESSQESFCYRILSFLMSELEDYHEELASLMFNSGIEPEPDYEKLKSDNNYFSEMLRKIQRILKRNSPDAQIIILIDEFTYIYDWIKQNKISEDFMKFWKALLTNYDISAIIVGQDHMMKFINDVRFTNAFGVIRTWEVNYLSKPDACNLITKPVSSSPDYAGSCGCTILKDAVDYLIELTSGSAYLLMNVCADFVDYLNERHSLIGTRGHAEDFIRRSLSKFEERWFEPLFNDKIDLDSVESVNANKELLKKIALNSAFSDGVFSDDLNLSEKENSKLQDLLERKVVERKNNKISIIVKLYAEWLRNKFGSR